VTPPASIAGAVRKTAPAVPEGYEYDPKTGKYRKKGLAAIA
jgi:hypothetical protein